MDFNPTIWGTFGQWVSSSIATLALLTTAFVVWRDTNERRVSQARQVAYYVKENVRSVYEFDQEEEDPIHDYTVSNLSPEPIYDVMQVSDHKGSVGLLEFRAVLLPGHEHVFEGADYTRVGPPILSFRDNSGAVWARSISGRLHKTGTRKDWFGSRPPKGFNPDELS